MSYSENREGTGFLNVTSGSAAQSSVIDDFATLPFLFSDFSDISCLTGFLFSLEELFRLILKQSLVIGYQLLANHRFRFLKQYSLMHTCAQKQLFLRDLHNNHVHIVSDLRAG